MNTWCSHIGFSATMRKMSSRNSPLTHLLPTATRCREIHFQYNLNPARCQRTTVSGCRSIRDCSQPGQSRLRRTRNILSGVLNLGCRRLSFGTASCCRRAREEIATRTKGPDKQYEQKPQQTQHKESLTRRTRRNREQFYLTDSVADRVLARHNTNSGTELPH